MTLHDRITQSPPDRTAALASEITACRLCASRFADTWTAHMPRPVPWLSDRAPVLIVGQAPGARVHASGRPFDDRSGDRLREWMGVTRDDFYDRARFAILPMAFCFPGYGPDGADLPPPAICAANWRARALEAMPQIRLKLLIGAHAQRWHLGRAAGRVGDTVAAWDDFGPATIPLPHPSWRNTGWLRRNPWFETDLVPHLRTRISQLAAAD